jgi:hypothetical protein
MTHHLRPRSGRPAARSTRWAGGGPRGDKTFAEDFQRVRTGNQPNAYAAIRNLGIGAFRRAGFANIAHARRYYGGDDRRILALCGYT